MYPFWLFVYTMQRTGNLVNLLNIVAIMETDVAAFHGSSFGHCVPLFEVLSFESSERERKMTTMMFSIYVDKFAGSCVEFCLFSFLLCTRFYLFLCFFAFFVRGIKKRTFFFIQRHWIKMFSFSFSLCKRFKHYNIMAIFGALQRWWTLK